MVHRCFTNESFIRRYNWNICKLFVPTVPNRMHRMLKTRLNWQYLAVQQLIWSMLLIELRSAGGCTPCICWQPGTPCFAMNQLLYCWTSVSTCTHRVSDWEQHSRRISMLQSTISTFHNQYEFRLLQCMGSKNKKYHWLYTLVSCLEPSR